MPNNDELVSPSVSSSTLLSMFVVFLIATSATWVAIYNAASQIYAASGIWTALLWVIVFSFMPNIMAKTPSSGKLANVAVRVSNPLRHFFACAFFILLGAVSGVSMHLVALLLLLIFIRDASVRDLKRSVARMRAES